MRNSRFSFLIIIIFCFTKVTGFSQLNWCGTELTNKQRNFELSFTDSVTSLIDINRTLNVTLFIVKDKKGDINVDLPELNAAFSGLNSAFGKIKLNFRISLPNIIDNYHFNVIKKIENETEMVAQNFVSNTINVYLVDSLFDANNQEVCGYTYYPSEGKDVILINKKCVAESYLIEQFGHYFNLYHTHEKGFAEELVNGTNCNTAGDLCCDTPADPNLSGMVTPECQYSSLVQDKNKEYYTPTVFNYMSFSPNDCNKCFFSTEQYIRVINCILKTKSYLW